MLTIKPFRFLTMCFCVSIDYVRTEYGDLLRKYPYSVRIQENTDQKNSVFGHFSRSDGGFNFKRQN